MMGAPAQPFALGFAAAFALGDDSLRRLVASPAAPAAPDPLRLDLPSLPPVAAKELTPAALGALGALYLHAELEQAGLLSTLDALAETRRSLHSLPPETADKLERYALEARDHYARAEREDLFARVFGLGPAVSLGPHSTANLPFRQALARLCGAILRAYEAGSLPAIRRAREDALLSEAARQLLDNLSGHRHGNALIAARRLHARVKQAFDILGDPGLTGLLGTRAAWASLEKLAGRGHPDLADCAKRGVAGQRLIAWLGKIAQLLGENAPIPPVDEALAHSAAAWLLACGFAVNPRSGGPV